MIWTDDPVRDAERYFAEQEEELQGLPECGMCGQPIQGPHVYEIFGQRLCDDCITSCRWDIDEYMEEN